MTNQKLSLDDIYQQVGAISGEKLVALIRDSSSGYSIVRSPLTSDVGKDGIESFFVAVVIDGKKVIVPRHVFLWSGTGGVITVTELCPLFNDLFKLLGVNDG